MIEDVLRAIFRKDAILLDRGIGHGRLVALYALGLVLCSFPWLLEASGLARAESRRFLFERFVSVEWALSGILIPFVAAKLMRREPRLRRTIALCGVSPARFLLPKLLLVALFASELLLVAAPLAMLLHDMGAGAGSEWVLAQLELFVFLSMLAAVAILLQLVLDPPLAALGATYVAESALVWIGGGFERWLALGAVTVVLIALRSQRALLYAE
jgi:hypothetical protein